MNTSKKTLLAFLYLTLVQWFYPSLADADITLGVNDWPGYVAWYIAEQKGFFQKHKAAVKLVWLDSLTQSLDDFAAGKLDVNSQPWSDTLILLSKGTPFKVVLALDYSAGADALMVAPRIARLADLKGKKVAVEQGTVSEFLLGTALSKAGLSAKDVQLVNLPANEGAQAFLDGKLDATATYNPFVNQIQATRKGRPLFSSKDMPGLVADVVVVSDKALKQKRADCVGMVKAWYDVERFIREHRDEAVAIMAAVVKQTPDEYRLFLPGVRFLNAKDNAQAFAPASDPRSLAGISPQIIRFLTDAKLVKGNVDLSSVLDQSLVLDAAKP
jgi:NitT/TauT family transport system substrate-binding protein